MSGWTRGHIDNGFLDQEKPLKFSINGKRCQGLAGDTLASAMLANGIAISGRSALTNQPRGIMAAGDCEQNAYMQLKENGDGRIVLASQQELYEGLDAESLLPWPLPRRFDRGKAKSAPIEDSAAPIHTPYRQDVEKGRRYGHCDVLVIGSGPAGLAAARSASRAGARVMVVERDRDLGGSLMWCPGVVDDAEGLSWARETCDELRDQDGAELLTRATAVGLDEKNRMVVLQLLGDELGNGDPASGARVRVWRIEARQIVLATGAADRSLVYPDNDKPGTFTASGLLEYANRFGLRHDGKAVLLTNSDAGHRSACALYDAGFDVQAVIDYRQNLDAGVIGPVCDRGIDIAGSRAIVRVGGEEAVDEVFLAKFQDNQIGEAAGSYSCDLVAVAGGARPRLDLFVRAGGELSYDPKRDLLSLKNSGLIDLVAGAAAGDVGLSEALRFGARAGHDAAERCGLAAGELDAPIAEPEISNPAAIVWAIDTPGSNQAPSNQWVDLRQERTAADYAENGNNGFVSPLADAQLEAPPLPVTPTTVLIEAESELPQARRLLPTHPWHAEQRAAFRRLQDWLKPAFYPREGVSAEDILAEEVQAVRKAAGLHDLSAITKIEVSGPDARTFLDRIYCSNLADLAPGQIRYSMMLDESGSILDHGIVTCLADDRFFITASDGYEETVLSWLEGWLASDWQELKAFVSPVTHQWATLLVAGPRARQILLDVQRDIDVSTAAFPYMAVREGSICGVPARMMRVGHLGEVSYEVYVPANYGMALWRKIIVAGRKYDLRPFGDDAYVRLMAEKGHVRLRVAGDAVLTPFDLDFPVDLDNKTEDFIGKRALMRPGARDRHRLQLVGLKAETPDTVLPANGTVVTQANPRHNDELQDGLVATSFLSPSLNQPIALGLVTDGRSRIGEVVKVRGGANEVIAKIVKPSVFDPHGRRRHG